MRAYLKYLFFLFLPAVLIACGQPKGAGTPGDESLQYDTSRIAIFKWDRTKFLFPHSSAPLALSAQDLVVTDSLLHDAIDSFNVQVSPGLFAAFGGKISLDSLIIKKAHYKFQYFPYTDWNGQHVLRIIGFSTHFGNWKSEIYLPRLHYGMRMLDLKINLSRRTRENIVSGDFG